jgi:hypothetical protein
LNPKEPITIRPFRNGDEEEISRIYEKCYSKYSGYTSREPSFWKWFNKDRPDLHGIFVAETGNRIIGSLTYARGEIIDPCYDPEHCGKEVMTALFEAAEEVGRAKGINSITVNVPEKDSRMKSSCEQFGMRRREINRVYSISLFDIREVIRLILERSKPKPGRYGMRVLCPGGEEHFVINVSDDGVSLEEGILAPIRISIDAGTLNNLVFNGTISLWDPIFHRIYVSPPWKFYQGIGFLRFLILDVDWFSPRGAFF